MHLILDACRFQKCFEIFTSGQVDFGNFRIKAQSSCPETIDIPLTSNDFVSGTYGVIDTSRRSFVSRLGAFVSFITRSSMIRFSPFWKGWNRLACLSTGQLATTKSLKRKLQHIGPQLRPPVAFLLHESWPSRSLESSDCLVTNTNQRFGGPRPPRMAYSIL